MLNCKQVATLASDYLDNNTPLKWQMRLHLMMCGNCRRFVRHLKVTKKVSAHMASEKTTEDTEIIWQNLQAQIKKERQSKKE
jgi:hypothetical protein